MKRLKNYRISETYEVEFVVNAYSEKEAQEKFDKFMSDVELITCNDNEVSWYVQDETLKIEESNID